MLIDYPNQSQLLCVLVSMAAFVFMQTLIFSKLLRFYKGYKTYLKKDNKPINKLEYNFKNYNSAD